MDAQLTSSRDGGGAVLEDVSSALGVEGSDFSQLNLKLKGQRATVAVQQDEEGRAHGLRLTVSFEGPARASGADDDVAPSILLRGETEADVRDKERDLTREVQVGYEKFDHAVFIDNDSSEADVRRILSKEATRQAVLRLLEAGFTVRISVRQAIATRRLRSNEKRLAGQPVLDALEDLLIVSRAGGPGAGGPATAKRGSTLMVVSGVMLGLSLIYAWVAHSVWPASIVLAIFGLVVAGGVAIFSRPSIEAACSGDSGSGARSRNIVGALSIAAGALVFGAIMHLNGALDSEEPERRLGVVISAPVTGRRDDGKGQGTIVRWDDGETSNVNKWLEWTRFELDERVVEYVHPGALGFTWRAVGRARR